MAGDDGGRELASGHDAAAHGLLQHAIRVFAVVVGRREAREDLGRVDELDGEVAEADGAGAVLKAQLNRARLRVLGDVEPHRHALPSRRAVLARRMLPVTLAALRRKHHHELRPVPGLARLRHVLVGHLAVHPHRLARVLAEVERQDGASVIPRYHLVQPDDEAVAAVRGLHLREARQLPALHLLGRKRRFQNGLGGQRQSGRQQERGET